MTDPVLANALSPARTIRGDKGREPEEGLALCLSGGGYRAMVFHIGVLWRLNEVGLLPTIKRFSSVSGGSITAGVLAMNWTKLAFDDRNVASNFAGAVVDPLRRMAGLVSTFPLSSPGLCCQAYRSLTASPVRTDGTFSAVRRYKTFPSHPASSSTPRTSNPVR